VGNRIGTESDSVDKYVVGFCKKAMKVLEGQDKRVAENIQKSKFPGFFKNEHRGLGLFGTCERDMQYLIFADLCKEYKVYPEWSGSYKNMQRADIAIWTDEKATEDDMVSDVAIEMKWAHFKKDGFLYDYSIQNLVDDVLKMKRHCVSSNKYFMQLAITDERLDFKSNAAKKKFEDDVNWYFDKRAFRNCWLAFTYHVDFETRGVGDNIRFFNMLLWKIRKITIPKNE
jgi:hypothetical protein